MRLAGKVAVVTGGASGIGAALCRRFAAEGARAVVVADLDLEGAEAVAAGIGGMPQRCDVAREADLRRLVDDVTRGFGGIDLLVSNAGIAFGGDEQTPDAEWRRMFDVNTMSHVWAARAVLPQMLARGEGYLLSVASAAGLLSQPGSAPYAVTKHAAVAFAEWLAFTYGDRGIKVSCLCPMGVRTPMLEQDLGGMAAVLLQDAVSAEEVASEVVAGLAAERFLILPHPQVHEYLQQKAADRDRWLAGMRRLHAQVFGE
ncbi:MAG: oxidoreductase, short chain dehydrogenase/reductase family [Gemmatimonadetes bacterium]|nr:oxidoreductase, short chain dehydrogenase/reductase family [Gemmatimonadota bacterium]